MAKDTKKKKVKSEKKESKTFFKDFKAELKKVTWPTAKQLVQKTAVVIVIVLIIAAIVFALDTVFGKGYEFIIDQASKAVKTEQNITNETTENAVEETVEVEEATDVTLDANTTEENVTAE